MPRWDPDGQERLVKAASELFVERGYDAVTIADIAERAGLTRRSFFRYFPDKREVLFTGSMKNTADITRALEDFDPDASARDALVGTLAQMGEFLLRKPAAQARRQNLIESSPELQERERTKLASIASALAVGLIDRGVPRGQADMVGGVAAQIFQAAYLEAIRESDRESFETRLRASFHKVMALLAG